MIVFRLSKSVFSMDLSGNGAEKSGGRWNSKGTAMIYTGQNRALCTAEIAVHTPLGNIPVDYEIVTIEIPDDAEILELEEQKLPPDWKLFLHPNSTQKIGNQFIAENKFLVFKVPSAVVKGEFNYLVNPGHTGMKRVKIVSVEPFDFDERLFLK